MRKFFRLVCLPAIFLFFMGLSFWINPQTLLAWREIDRTFFNQMPHWVWSAGVIILGLLAIDIFLLYVDGEMYKIRHSLPPEFFGDKNPRPARSLDSWRKNWEKTPESTRSVRSVKFDDMIFPDKPSHPRLVLTIRCKRTSFTKGCGFTLITKCEGEMQAHHHDFRR